MTQLLILGCLAWAIGGAWKAYEKKRKEEEEKRLLAENPHAWEAKKRVEIMREDSRRAGRTNAAMNGMAMAWRLFFRK